MNRTASAVVTVQAAPSARNPQAAIQPVCEMRRDPHQSAPANQDTAAANPSQQAMPIPVALTEAREKLQRTCPQRDRPTPKRAAKAQRFFALRQTPDRIALPQKSNWPSVTVSQESAMPEQETIRRAERDKQEGKSPSTQAGEFVREEMDHVRQGVHGARSTKQAMAIGLSKARRAGVDLPPRPGKKASSFRSSERKSSRKRANSSLRALRREGSSSASPAALSRFAKASARKRGSASRHRAAAKAAQTRSHNRPRPRR
jgi:Family of unknown function (DUF6496)